MRFSDDPHVEALIGRVCLIFARVEQEAGRAVEAAHGNWGVMRSTDFLDYSSRSGKLLDWLNGVSTSYPEVESDTNQLCAALLALKAQRDQWAHSAAMVDPFLLMKELDPNLRAISDSDIPRGKLLHGQSGGHIDAPTEADVDNFAAQASDVGDAAAALGDRLNDLISTGEVRPVRPQRR